MGSNLATALLAASLVTNLVLIGAMASFALSRRPSSAAAKGAASSDGPSALLIDDLRSDPDAEARARKEGVVQRFTPKAPGVLTDLTVMVADDDETNVEVLVGMLEHLGLSSLIVARNGQEAVDCAQRTAVDLILMDIQMPRLTGLDAARLILRQPGNGRVPIIPVTGFSRIVNEAMCADAGMIGFLQKPVRIDLLKAEIMKALRPARKLAS